MNEMIEDEDLPHDCYVCLGFEEQLEEKRKMHLQKIKVAEANLDKELIKSKLKQVSLPNKYFDFTKMYKHIIINDIDRAKIFVYAYRVMLTFKIKDSNKSLKRAELSKIGKQIKKKDISDYRKQYLHSRRDLLKLRNDFKYYLSLFDEVARFLEYHLKKEKFSIINKEYHISKIARIIEYKREVIQNLTDIFNMTGLISYEEKVEVKEDDIDEQIKIAKEIMQD